MITVGLDLSLTSTGIARLDAAGHTTSTVPNKDTKAPMWMRLNAIWDGVYNAVGDGPRKADLVVIEDVPRGAHGIVDTAKVHGLIAWQLGRYGYDTILVPAATLKVFALGKGVGTKTEMTLAAARRLGYEGVSDDCADALWLAHLGAHLLGQPQVDLPATHLRALTKLTKAAA